MGPLAEVCGVCGDLALRPWPVLCYLALWAATALVAAVLLVLAVTVWLTWSSRAQVVQGLDARRMSAARRGG